MCPSGMACWISELPRHSSLSGVAEDLSSPDSPRCHHRSGFRFAPSLMSFAGPLTSISRRVAPNVQFQKYRIPNRRISDCSWCRGGDEPESKDCSGRFAEGSVRRIEVFCDGD